MKPKPCLLSNHFTLPLAIACLSRAFEDARPHQRLTPPDISACNHQPPPEPHKPQTAMRIAPRESAVKGLLLVQLESDDLGRAVSRILSAPKTLGGENQLSQQPVPGTRSAARNLERAAPGSPIWPCTRWGFPCLRACAWSGGLLPHLFTLTSAPLPEPGRSEFLWHYPSGRLAASPPACIPRGPSCVGPRRLRGIAPYGVRTFLLPQVALGKAILRPSKIKATIPPCC